MPGKGYCLGAGMPRKEQPLHDAMRLFDGRFRDTRDTIVVIDEIQDSVKVYSSDPAVVQGSFPCDFVITGSYLGRHFPESIFSRLAI